MKMVLPTMKTIQLDMKMVLLTMKTVKLDMKMVLPTMKTVQLDMKTVKNKKSPHLFWRELNHVCEHINLKIRPNNSLV